MESRTQAGARLMRILAAMEREDQDTDDCDCYDIHQAATCNPHRSYW